MMYGGAGIPAAPSGATARPAASEHPAYRTQICTRWMQGSCQYGDRCNFAHGEGQLRQFGATGQEPAAKRARMEQVYGQQVYGQQVGGVGGAASSVSPRGSLRMCKYGMGCTRVECWHQHPEGWSAEKAIASSLQETLYLDPADVPKLIGPGGSTIKQLCTQSGCKAHVNKAEDGRAAIVNGKAFVSLMGPEIGVSRFKAMVEAKIAEIKLREAGLWTAEMQRQQNELMGTRDSVESGRQGPAYTAHNTAHNDASKAGHYQQLFSADGREYFCNTANMQAQWERPPPGSTIVPGRRPPSQGAAMAAQPSQTFAPPAAAQPVRAGMVMHAQNASVMPFHAALAATGQSVAAQMPPAPQLMQQTSPASPKDWSPTAAKETPALDAAQALYAKQYKNFQVYGGYYTADNQWKQGEPPKPDGTAAPAAVPATAPAASPADVAVTETDAEAETEAKAETKTEAVVDAAEAVDSVEGTVDDESAKAPPSRDQTQPADADANCEETANADVAVSENGEAETEAEAEAETEAVADAAEAVDTAEDAATELPKAANNTAEYRAELEQKSRKELQTLAKEHGIKANLSSSKIIDALCAQ